MVVNERLFSRSYYAKVPKRRTAPRPAAAQPDWYLPEWMRTLNVSQATLARECDWPPNTMHGIYHGRTHYYREIVNLIAAKLKIEPYELLMHPDQAFALRRQREDALRIVQATAPLQRTGTNDQ